MQLVTEDLGAVVVLTLPEQKLDATISTVFKEMAVKELRDDRKVYLLDLEPIRFLDSSGLGAIVGIRKAIGRDGQMHICGLSPAVERVFELLKMNRIFQIFETREEALAEYQIKEEDISRSERQSDDTSPRLVAD